MRTGQSRAGVAAEAGGAAEGRVATRRRAGQSRAVSKAVTTATAEGRLGVGATTVGRRPTAYCAVKQAGRKPAAAFSAASAPPKREGAARPAAEKGAESLAALSLTAVAAAPKSPSDG